MITRLYPGSQCYNTKNLFPVCYLVQPVGWTRLFQPVQWVTSLAPPSLPIPGILTITTVGGPVNGSPLVKMVELTNLNMESGLIEEEI